MIRYTFGSCPNPGGDKNIIQFEQIFMTFTHSLSKQRHLIAIQKNQLNMEKKKNDKAKKDKNPIIKLTR